MSGFAKRTKVRSERLKQSAEGQDCTIRLPGVCCFDPSKTVLAHLPGHDKGTATKENDIHAAFACSECHDVIDGRAHKHLPGAIVLDACLRGLSETQAIWIASGLLVVPR